MKIQVITIAIIAIFFMGCDPDEVTIKYDISETMEFEVVHEGIYSTMSNGVEEIGTDVKSWLKITFNRDGEQYLMQSQFVADNSRGYLAKSMPPDLSHRMHYEVKSLGEYGVHEVKGFEKFIPLVVNKLDIPTIYRNQLKNPNYVKLFKRRAKKAWEWSHLLKEGESYPSHGDITETIKSQRKFFPIGVELDSVKTVGIENIEGRDCLQYNIFYREKVEFPYYLWAQWAYGTTEGKNYKNFDIVDAKSDVQYSVHIDIDNSVVCRENEIRKEHYLLKNKESGADAEFSGIASIERNYRPLGSKENIKTYE